MRCLRRFALVSEGVIGNVQKDLDVQYKIEEDDDEKHPPKKKFPRIPKINDANARVQRQPVGRAPKKNVLKLELRIKDANARVR